ncbi:MAG: hypothetical protein M5U28_38840 [Sandaracinaceae bacterium]|nr:hypothetical protein [Sandaracinaceae bacterium]
MSRRIDVRANGLRFSLLEEGEGDRLALCLHGFPELGYSWRHQLPLLARLGYRVWARTCAATAPAIGRGAREPTPSRR